ncbi:MAG: sulfite exporter TauE/SafE family protein [Betaproteobacteria bacterium]|nr:sulfite exporter TauE/SafE family protein [Betaproteobacteria bacterium]
MIPADWLPAPGPQLACAMAIVLLAGVVRGFAGFGFSALTVAGMSLFFSPAQVVPAVFVLEVVASLTLLRSVWGEIHWGWLRPLLVGNALAIPLGVWMLAVVPEGPLRALVSLVILSAAVLLLSGFKAPWSDTPRLRLGTGLVSGVFNGLAAIGGMAVAVMLFTTAISGAAARATLIALFFATDLYALAWAGANDLLDANLLRWVAWLFAPMLIGIAIGRRHFLRVDEAGFRRAVLRVLAVMAGLGLLRAGWR